MADALIAFENAPIATCPCCGYEGRFLPYGVEYLTGSKCPSCDSFQRHRLFRLACDAGFVRFAGKRILHFAEEAAVRKTVEADNPGEYVTADLNPDAGGMVLNIEDIDLPSDSFDTIICFHVLEHVDDTKAMPELFRILKPGGELLAMVPIIYGWNDTYEDPEKRTPRERELYFGQDDHVRIYGGDFPDRLRKAGFVIDEYTAGGEMAVKYALIRGEKLYRCTKPAAAD